MDENRGPGRVDTIHPWSTSSFCPMLSRSLASTEAGTRRKLSGRQGWRQKLSDIPKNERCGQLIGSAGCNLFWICKDTTVQADHLKATLDQSRTFGRTR